MLSTKKPFAALVLCVAAPWALASTQNFELRYGSHPRQAATLVAPANPSGLLVWVHDGGWVQGDKLAASGRSVIERATRLNYAVLAVNYRYANSRTPQNSDHGRATRHQCRHQWLVQPFSQHPQLYGLAQGTRGRQEGCHRHGFQRGRQSCGRGVWPYFSSARRLCSVVLRGQCGRTVRFYSNPSVAAVAAADGLSTRRGQFGSGVEKFFYRASQELSPLEFGQQRVLGDWLRPAGGRDSASNGGASHSRRGIQRAWQPSGYPSSRGRA